MKVRKGFVSNSSSSSFICCYARVTDEAKAKAYVEGKDANILTTEEAIAQKQGWIEYGADWAGVFEEPDIIEGEDHKYLVMESYGGAGDSDSDFCDGCGCWDMNYDVDISDFEQYEQDFIAGVSEATGFTDIKVGYGAGRNG